MLTYEIHPILCDDIRYIDSQPFKVAKVTKIVMNLYLLSIQKALFKTVTMLTPYKCQNFFTPEPNIYRGWTVTTAGRNCSMVARINKCGWVINDNKHMDVVLG